jgi:hypothetical protein
MATQDQFCIHLILVISLSLTLIKVPSAVCYRTRYSQRARSFALIISIDSHIKLNRGCLRYPTLICHSCDQTGLL